MASPPPSPPSGSRRRPAATFSPAGSHLLPRPHLLPGVAPPPPSSRPPPPPPTFLPAPPRPAPSSRRRPSPHLLPGAAPPHTFFPAPPLPPPSSRRRPTFRRRAAPTSRPRTACTHPKRRRPILRLAKRHRPAHRRGPPPPLPPWPFDAITPGRSTPPPHAVHRRSTLDPPNYLSQCASADRLPPLERRCGPSPISLPWHSAVDCALPHLPLVPRGGIQGRARPFTAATPSVRSALPTKAVQRGVVQKQRSSTNSSISLVSCFAVDPILGVHEHEHPVFGGEMKATHDPCFPSSPPTRVSSLPITSTTTYSSRWLHWPPSATSSSTMVTGSRPSGARTSVQVESRPPSSPSAAQPSKSSTYNSPRFRVYNTSLDSPRPCTPPEIRRATRRWRARSFFSWSWLCCSTA